MRAAHAEAAGVDVMAVPVLLDAAQERGGRRLLAALLLQPLLPEQPADLRGMRSRLPRCRGAEVPRCRGAEVPRCRGAGHVEGAVSVEGAEGAEGAEDTGGAEGAEDAERACGPALPRHAAKESRSACTPGQPQSSPMSTPPEDGSRRHASPSSCNVSPCSCLDGGEIACEIDVARLATWLRHSERRRILPQASTRQRALLSAAEGSPEHAAGPLAWSRGR